MIFLRPALAKMQGLQKFQHDIHQMISASDLPENDQRQDYLRAIIEKDGSKAETIRAFSEQDSSMMATLTNSDALIIRKPHAPALKAGESVDVLKMPNGIYSG